MGIYDRDYVRRGGPSFLGSIAQRGRVCKWLIGTSIVVFIVQALTRSGGPFTLGWFTSALDLDVSRVMHGEIWRLLTYAFLHHPDRILPILFNMLFLWWFGTEIEETYGSREFLAFYLSACLAGGLLFLFSSLAWMPRAQATLGAFSGVAAVMTLCTIHFPTRTILLFFILPVPLWLALVLYLAVPAYLYLSVPEMNAGLAPLLGGALFAGVYYLLHIRLVGWLPSVWDGQFWRGQLQSWRRRLFGPRLRLFVDESPPPRSRAPRSSERRSSPTAEGGYQPEEATKSSVSAPVADEHLEAKMDAILEKISRVGKENLTESEREFLLRASEIFRRRRT